MTPVPFSQANAIYAKDHPEYVPLPAYRTRDGEVITCWALTWRERFRVLFSGRIWWSVLTFRQPLQPQRPRADNPFRVPWMSRMIRKFTKQEWTHT